ncbi:MAG TPA: hypothetical protein VFC39_19125 [Acidobacteriaceae bacterium]|nr:hypothetical protein [Acidobacteriaceae bacterium]
MPDEIKRKSRLRAPAMLIGASALAVLLSLGLCSVSHFNLEGQSSSPLANAGVIAFFAGMIGGFVGIIWLIIAATLGPRHN